MTKPRFFCKCEIHVMVGRSDRPGTRPFDRSTRNPRLTAELGTKADAAGHLWGSPIARPAPEPHLRSMNWIYDILQGPSGEPLDMFAARIGKEVERLIREEERFNLAVQLARIAVFRVGVDLKYEWAFNQQFEVEEDGGDIVGKSNSELFAPEDAALVDSMFSEAFRTGLSQTVDVRLRSLTPQHDLHLELLVDPVRGESGEVIALTGAALDLSAEVERHREIRAARREANEARELAEQANRAKTRFMAAAGHDLRQPLQALRFFQNAVADRFRAAGDANGLKAAEAIENAVSSAEELLNSLMDLATLESGQIQVRVVDFPVHEVVNSNVSGFRGMAERRGLELRVRPCSAVIRSDPVLLKRIIRNLTINAIKYTSRGGVLVGCRRRGDFLRVEVWDTGRGIPADKLAIVFDEFFRGDEAKDPGGGLGIGLTIVARTARLLGHPITVRSHEGRGSLFAVTVPLA